MRKCKIRLGASWAMQFVLLHSRAHRSALPRGVIGNTTDFGSVILGSSPSGVAGQFVSKRHKPADDAIRGLFKLCRLVWILV